MKTSLLGQNDNLVVENLKQNVGRSVFDLSHSKTFPVSVDGAIYPICAIECVPSDSFEINAEVLLRQLNPLKVPLMTNLRVNTAYYFVDNRLVWNHWERFISGGRSGNETFSIPQVFNSIASKDDNGETVETKVLLNFDDTSTKKITLANSLHTYFGINFNRDYDTSSSPDNTDFNEDDLPIAFPFAGYQFICRDFYTDIDRLAESNEVYNTNFDDTFNDWTYENLFPVDKDDFMLSDGASITMNNIVLDKIRYHNVRDDYFTTSKKAPMRGDVPSIDTTIATGFADFSNVAQKLDVGVGNILSTDVLGVFKEDSPSTKEGLGIGSITRGSGVYASDALNYKDNASEHLLSLLNKNEVKLQFANQIDAASIRLLSQLTVWAELNMMHKPTYDSFLNAHFNSVNVGESLVEKPQFIGATSQVISINEILQTSQTSETSPLGNQGATSMSLASNYVGKYYCNSYGWIIGVCYIMPDMIYTPSLPRSFSRKTKEDYYSPEFANLSMQATLNKELYFSNDDDWNNTPWGYTGAFDELRSIPNTVAGDMLNSSYTDLKKWALLREFDNSNLPSMSSEFLSLKDNVDKSAWSVPTMPQYMLQVANLIKAVRPMPFVAIPKTL